jgi:hypothetical protein
MPEIVKVRLWDSGIVLVNAQGPCDVRLQPADNALRAALVECTQAFFEAWLPGPDADWIIGRRVEDQLW